MTGFNTFVMVDWSGGNDRGPTPKKDAIWVCVARIGEVEQPVYLRNRQLAELWLGDLIAAEIAAGRRVFAGFDFPFGYPEGFGADLTGSDDPLLLWQRYEDLVKDAPDRNNRFDLAGTLNAGYGGVGPFWGNALKRDIAGLPRTKAGYANPFPDRRRVELLARGSFTCWQMAGVGSVGGQVMMGLPVLHRLRTRFAGQVAVWPFEPLDRPVAFVEIWPSLTVGPPPDGVIKDAWQVQQVARTLSQCAPAELARQLDVHAPVEGWILGVAQRRKDAA